MQGDELKTIRKQAGLTQSELADIIGVSTTYVGLMERNEKPITKRTGDQIDAMLRERIDVSYSDAAKGWIVAVTRPGKPPASREHHLLAIKPSQEAATQRASEELKRNPLAMLIVRVPG